jgi:haloalkane dehalogenase
MQDVSKAAFPEPRTGVSTQSRAGDSQAQLLGTSPQFIDVGHSRLAYWKIGVGADLVFVHGWPLHSAAFRGIVPLLAPHFTCHLLDLPGSGHTICTASTPLDFSAHAGTVFQAIGELGLGRYALLAHDSGGFIARLIAARDSRVFALVLGNTELPDHVPALIRFYAALARLPFAASLVRLTLSSRLLRESAVGFGDCFSDKRHLRGEFHELFVKPLLESPAYDELQLSPLAKLDFKTFRSLPGIHRAIRAPVLLAWGDRDPFFPIKKARKMADQFGGLVEFSVVEGAKLFAHEERPDEFGALARDFLSKHAIEHAQAKASC